jgi:hypothetical protein
MRWFLRDLFIDGDWLDRTLGAFMLLCGLGAVMLLASLPWLLREDARERDALHAEGCEVVGSHTVMWLMPMRSGNQTILIPQQHVVEHWRCTDGREFER